MAAQVDLWHEGLSGWEFISAPAAEALSFSIEDEPPLTIPVWRLDLPPDPKQAEQFISHRSELTRASTLALESIPQRVDQLIKRRSAAEDSVTSFDTKAAPLPAPEAELLRLLDVIDTGEAVLSFSSAGPEAGALDQVGKQFLVASQRLLRLFSHFAWVDTLVLGQLVGHTQVGWNGSMNTAWLGRLDQAQMNLHLRNLETALEARNVSLRILTVSIQSAVKLSVLLAAPGGAFLALPAAWKFVNHILAQARSN
jgi:hypothetical protein